jgi:hypothetical protein
VLHHGTAQKERMNCILRVTKWPPLLLALLSLAGSLSCGASRANQPGVSPGTIQFQGSQYSYHNCFRR